VELRAQTAAGRPFVQSYGAGRFRVGGQAIEGSVVILPDRVERWSVDRAQAITIGSLAPVLTRAGELDLLILGCGLAPIIVAADLREAARGLGLVVEAMSTGAACRTFNVLLAEDRRVAAALIAVA
jgi:uncharacterized protein